MESRIYAAYDLERTQHKAWHIVEVRAEGVREEGETG